MAIWARMARAWAVRPWTLRAGMSVRVGVRSVLAALFQAPVVPRQGEGMPLAGARLGAPRQAAPQAVATLLVVLRAQGARIRGARAQARVARTPVGPGG
ncbi:MAG: hypothetical protein B6A08_10015 [Sorangiineae bacterium NIC37A_2]|nr:MAG: hypothetical protein B6A08_10015 [Sorangiineae bacterium NIC37A_2]